jgi:hypothetical protein
VAITAGLVNSFKQEILQEGHDVDNDTFKIALYSSSATLDADTTAYTTTGEITGTGYTAGGETLTGGAVTLDGSVAVIDFDNPQWTSASFTARGALIYNSTNSDKAMAVLDFGADQVVSSGTFTVTFPAANASTALIRLA